MVQTPILLLVIFTFAIAGSLPNAPSEADTISVLIPASDRNKVSRSDDPVSPISIKYPSAEGKLFVEENFCVRLRKFRKGMFFKERLLISFFFFFFY